MEQRVDRLENDHRELEKSFNDSERDRQRDLGLLYTRIEGIASDLKMIKWFAATSAGAVITAVLIWGVTQVLGG